MKLKEGESSTAEIGPRDIEIKGSVGGESVRIGYDAGLGMSGVGDFLAIKTDYLHSKTGSDSPIQFESGVRLKNVPDLTAPLSSDIASSIGNLTAGHWCSSDGEKISCNNTAPVITESDPKVGTLTNGKWCSSNGSVITCTADPPSSGGRVHAPVARSANTNYVADSDGMLVGRTATSGNWCLVQLLINGTNYAHDVAAGGANEASASLLVPKGATYRGNISGGCSSSLLTWIPIN